MSNTKRLNREVAERMAGIDGGHYGPGYAGRVIKEVADIDPKRWATTPWYDRAALVIDFWLANYPQKSSCPDPEEDYQRITDDETDYLRVFPPFEGWSTPPP